MCYVCGKSRNKIAHSLDCRYVKMIPEQNKKYIMSRRMVADTDYRFCKCCAPILQYLRRERQDLDNYTQATGLSYTFNPSDGSLDIISKSDVWKIIVNGGQDFIWLYHKNYFDGNVESMVPGYHPQHIRKSTILGYMDYIVRHDIFRELNPLDAEKKHTKKSGQSMVARKADARSRRKADRLSKHRKKEKQLRREMDSLEMEYYDLAN